MINIGPGSNQSRVAVVSFSSSVVPEFGFSKYQTEVDVQVAIDNIKFVSGLSTISQKCVGPELDPDELSKIASDASHIFEVEDVNNLEAIRKELLIEICDIQGAQGDLIFVADSSRSIGHEAFDQLKKFAREVVKRFTISPQDMQLNTYRDQDEVIKAISKVKYLQGMQLTYTDKALTLLTRTGFTNQNGGRGAKIPKIAAVITDGVLRNAEATRAIANKAKQQGIIVFAISVGPYINEAGLDIMASDPTEFHS
ncbi:COL6A [Mytilus coruscus]|uniref:COL6A n=1 Tax=Mytilus coruscus TaxID=42192 RepID=A0A6J8BHV7_MYTCO|nr:COL6A [Mytilus coruscus]